MNTKPQQQTIYLPFQVSAQFLERLNQYWHRHRFPNRSAAMRFLLEQAMAQNLAPKPKKDG